MTGCALSMRRRTRAEIFETLKFCLTSRGEALPGEELARKLGVADTTLKTLAGRLRQRYSEILREEAAHSVASAGDVEDELKYLAVAPGALGSAAAKQGMHEGGMLRLHH